MRTSTNQSRRNLERLTREGLLYAKRRLLRLGIHSPSLALELVTMALSELFHHQHVHAERENAFGLLCAAIDRLIDRSADEAGMTN
jgi:hypothetical protein